MNAVGRSLELGGRLRLQWWLAGGLFLVHAAFFAAVFKLEMVSDLQVHATIARVGLESGTWWGTPLPYMSAAALGGFQTSEVNEGLTLLLAIAVAAKYLISVRIAEEEASTSVSWKLLGLLAALSFAFSLPANSIYLGQLPPNLFHNSTEIFLLPLALLLFWLSAQFLRSGENRWLGWMAVVGAINVLAKPSFVFAVLAVFPLMALARFRFGARLWKAAGVSAVIALFVGLQYLYIYKSGATEEVYRLAGFGGEAQSEVRLDPFNVWSHFSPNIPLSLLASLAFPLVAVAAYPRQIASYDLVRYSAALMAASVVIFSLFTETGVREFQGNFAWQAMVSNYILFLVVLIRVWSLESFHRVDARSVAVSVAFAAHVVSGLVFLAYYLANGTYF